MIGQRSLSFPGLLALGIGFLYTSVWAWSVVGYAFTRALVLPELDGPVEAALLRVSRRH